MRTELEPFGVRVVNVYPGTSPSAELVLRARDSALVEEALARVNEPDDGLIDEQISAQDD